MDVTYLGLVGFGRACEAWIAVHALFLLYQAHSPKMSIRIMSSATMDAKEKEYLQRIHELEKQIARLQTEIKKNSETQYGLRWMDVPEAFEAASENALPILEEIKEKAITNDDGKPTHILIEGDNFHALTSLNYTHKGQIDVIYIDPPYNTGSDGFVYKDKRVLDKYPDGTTVPTDHPLRHSYWLSFMHKRLELAKNLLSDRGVIFISIDDNEQANLKLLCDQVFGSREFIANIIWQKNYASKNNSQSIPAATEYIVAYSKFPDWTPNRLARTEEMDSKYKNPDNDHAPWRSDNPCAPGASTHQGMVYAIKHPFTGELLYPYSGACWRYQQDELLEIMNGWCQYELKDLQDDEVRANVCGLPADKVRKGVKGIVLSKSIEESKAQAEIVLKRGQWPKYYFTKNGRGGIARKTYLTNVEGRMITSFWPYSEVNHTDGAKKELKEIFNSDIPFDTPKPVALIKRIEEIASSSSSTILDFFAGSGTTMHATMQLNEEDGGHRQCILVQQNENNICESVTYERNRRVMQGYTNAKGEQVAGLGNSMKYYRTAFVGDNDITHITDADKVALTQRAGCLLALGENTLEEIKTAKAFQIFQLRKGDKPANDFEFTAVYFSGNLMHFADFRHEIEKLQQEHPLARIAVYVFTWGDPSVFENEFDDLSRLTIKPIPQPILEIYQNIHQL